METRIMEFYGSVDKIQSLFIEYNISHNHKLFSFKSLKLKQLDSQPQPTPNNPLT